MALFRFYMTKKKQSLAKTLIIKTKDELQNLLNDQGHQFSVLKIKKYKEFEPSTGWHTHVVLIQDNLRHWCVVGFLSENL